MDLEFFIISIGLSNLPVNGFKSIILTRFLVVLNLLPVVVTARFGVDFPLRVLFCVLSCTFEVGNEAEDLICSFFYVLSFGVLTRCFRRRA